jgi:hypothetical protein
MDGRMDGQTDRHDKANRHSLASFVEKVPKN